MKLITYSYLMACVLAATMPVLSRSGIFGGSVKSSETDVFPGWPTEFQGRQITQVPMLPREQKFYENFNGQIARFTDGHKQIVIRWVGEGNTEFHLTSRCFRAIGYDLKPQPAYKDEFGDLWGVFCATRRDEVLNVRERIVDAQNNCWTDESAWRWDTYWNHTTGPWWAYTVADRAVDIGDM